MVIKEESFEDSYAEFTAQSINGTFKRGFIEGRPRRIPFCSKDKKEHTDWLDKVCDIYKREFNEEIEYYFEKNMCYFKEKN